MDAVDLLLECHERIRRHCRGLLALAELTDRSAAPARETAARCARYFHEALPLHAADEEESVFPRLAPDAHTEQLSAEHVEIEAAIPPLVAALRAIADGEPPAAGFEAQPAAGFEAQARAFSALMLAHIAREEEFLFPRARALPSEEIVREIRARRVGP